MPEIPQHPGFIFAAYAIAAVVMAGLLLWVILDGRQQRSRLADLEARGARRRSAATQPATTVKAPASPAAAAETRAP
jgi:heme exporter protein D